MCQGVIVCQGPPEHCTAVCIILWNSTFFCASSREVSHSQIKEIKPLSGSHYVLAIYSFLYPVTLVYLACKVVLRGHNSAVDVPDVPAIIPLLLKCHVFYCMWLQLESLDTTYLKSSMKQFYLIVVIQARFEPLTAAFTLVLLCLEKFVEYEAALQINSDKCNARISLPFPTSRSTMSNKPKVSLAELQ